ncbi:MAG: TldD/PmbA family protein [Elusimicrobia bacterium]|nr:TldD/PmbA family protein [Elusimicrobiota bacterium]
MIKLELYAEESLRRTLCWEDGRLDSVTDTECSGVGLRALGDPGAYASLEARSPLTRGLTESETRRVRDQARLLGGRVAFHGRTWPRAPDECSLRPDLPFNKKIAWLSEADRAARNDPRVRQVRLTWGELNKTVGGVTFEDKSYFEQRSYRTFVVQVTAEQGVLRQTGYEVVAVQGDWNDLISVDPCAVSARAARRALMKLEAPSAPLGEMSVVIAAEAGGTLIHEAVGHSLEADAILDGSSPHYGGKVGRRVAGEKITVLDDPTRPGQRGSFLFDDEGTPARRTVLIENGVLRDYLYDVRSAQKSQRPSNGHGRRESFAHRPIPRMSNTFIAPGPDDPDDILRDLTRGLYVTRLGGGQVNTATGDFVFEVEEGYWVENGVPLHSVRGANLLGNGPEVLKSIDRMGWDLGWSVGTCGKEGQNVPVSDGLPTLRIPRVVVGGV